MSFHWCLPEERKAEETFLFALASRISPEKAGVERNHEAVEKYLLPLFEREDLHASVTENAIAFGLLGGLLRPGIGAGHLLPQHSPHWLAFRRLFLALCEEEIPEELRVGPGGSAWETMSEEEKSSLVDAFGLEKTGTGTSDAEAGLPPKFDWADLKKHYSKQFPVVREITKIRLASYESICLAAVKESLVETRRIDLDPVCGALYEISQNIAWEHLPESTELPRSRDVPTTLSLLADAVEETGIEFDLEAEYREAVRSVRAVLFDIATEMTVGKVVDPETDIWELEQMFCERRIVEEPYAVLTDERLLFHVADGMGTKGAGFLRRIGLMFETAEKKGVRVRIYPVKLTLAAHWVDPQFPLWLMTLPARLEFLRMLGIGEGEDLEDKVRELMKERKGSARSPLQPASKSLITGLQLQAKGTVYQGMTFRKYVEEASSFPVLREHVVRLSFPSAAPLEEEV